MAEHFFKRTSHHLGRFWSIKQSVVYEVSQNNNDKTCPQYHLSKSTNSNDGLDIADPSGIPSERVSQNLVKIKLTVEFFEARIKFYTSFPATRAVFVAHQLCITFITFVKLLVEKSKRFTTLGNSISGHLLIDREKKLALRIGIYSCNKFRLFIVYFSIFSMCLDVVCIEAQLRLLWGRVTCENHLYWGIGARHPKGWARIVM